MIDAHSVSAWAANCLRRRAALAALGCLLVALGSAGCSSSDSKVSVTGACSAAWEKYDLAFNAPTGDDTEAGTDVLNECASPEEWWQGGQPYRKSSFVSLKDDRDGILNDWCDAEPADTVVCSAR